jgi:hypothetical protein
VTAIIDPHTGHQQAISTASAAPGVHTATREVPELPADAGRDSRAAIPRRPAVSDSAVWSIVIGSIVGGIGGVVLAVACMVPLFGPTVGEALLAFLPLLGVMSGGIFGSLFGGLYALSLNR